VAEALYGWLPYVIQGVEPFLSSEDIHKGDVWFGEVSAKLNNSTIGILCLTPENLSAPWIHFEAGALSKQVEQKRVVPFLLGLVPPDLKPPLSNFQAVLPSMEDVLRLLKTVNEALGEKRLSDEMLNKSFEKWWPELEKNINAAKELLGHGAANGPQRTPEEILTEVLELVRGLAQRAPDLDAVRQAAFKEMAIQEENVRKWFLKDIGNVSSHNMARIFAKKDPKQPEPDGGEGQA
jgi:hypothetical protein